MSVEEQNNSEVRYPALKVRDPEGQQKTIWFKDFFEGIAAQPRVTLGRNADNDIVLEDPHKMISRCHCLFEYANGRWWVEDADSANGTFVRPSHGKTEIDVRLEESVPLKDGDEVLILGKMSAANEPIFWRLTFCDPDETVRVKKLQTVADIEYSLTQQRLFWVSPRERQEIKLSPLERKLLHFMAQRNRDNQDQAIVCDYQDLIGFIWEEPYGRTNNDVNRLIWSLRSKIEPDPGEPRFLKTVKLSGYLLEIKLIN
jgi:DNA-binding winged helix-turn-helix (wHTH) protein